RPLASLGILPRTSGSYCPLYWRRDFIQRSSTYRRAALASENSARSCVPNASAGVCCRSDMGSGYVLDIIPHHLAACGNSRRIRPVGVEWLPCGFGTFLLSHTLSGLAGAA